MKFKTHSYSVKIEWTGNLGQGTSNYKAYTRNHKISVNVFHRQLRQLPGTLPKRDRFYLKSESHIL